MEHTVKITDIAYGGAGVGRVSGKVVFVPFTAPGDEAVVEITEEKKGFAEGRLKAIVVPSNLRQEPPCPVFTRCGGCALQHITCPEQVSIKERILNDTIRRIGKIDDFYADEPCPSPDIFNYRSRARFQVAGGEWGFFEFNSNRIVDIDHCPIADPLLNRVFKRIKKLFTGARKDAVLLRALYSVNIGVSSADSMAVASFNLKKGAPCKWQDVLAGIEELKGLEVWLNPDKRGKGKKLASYGDCSVTHETHGLRYSSSINAFTQVNLKQNGKLIDVALGYAGLTGGEQVLDLYSGSGNLTLPAARMSRHATGVEYDREAVSAGRGNALANSADNVDFVCADVERWLKENIKNLENKGVDVVILDPARSGAMGAAKVLAGLRPKKIVYISCSPPTLARDLSILFGSGYGRLRATLIDMFPQTFHIEGVVVLELLRDMQ